MEFYRNVTRKQHSNGKAPANMAVYEQQARQQKQEREEAKRVALENAARQARIEKEVASQAAADRIMLEGLKRSVAKELGQFVPVMVMNEFFSRVVINALPHDKEYIEQCAESIVTVNKVYLHHLGGLKYLKEQATKTGSELLKKLHAVVKENSDLIIKSKLDEIKDATSEEEIQMIMKEPISADQAEKLEKDISELGADEISELVQNKVLDVVKDESKRQAEDAAFRQELAQRAKDYEDQDNDVLNPGMTNADANDEGRIPTEAEKEDEEEAKEAQSESALLAKYLVDPTVMHENTLFYSMVNSIYYDMIDGVKEEATNMVPKVPTKVLTSPLNLNMFDVYLNDYQDDLKHVDELRVANKQPLAGNEVRIDSEDVLAEALIQYTMLETAMTIKLITPSSDEVRAVANWNLRKR